MLVLNRKKDEVVVIGEPPRQIEVMVTEIRGDRVRLGIQAPEDVVVLRSELERKQ